MVARFYSTALTMLASAWVSPSRSDNLCAAAALHVGVYTFVRVHQTLNMTAAMAAGVTDTLWSLEALYDVILHHARAMTRRANIRKLIERLNRGA